MIFRTLVAVALAMFAAPAFPTGDLLRRIDVRVLDHLVIGRGAEVSFAERGFIRGG